MLAFSCAMISNIYFLQFLFQVGHIISDVHKFRPLHNCIVFVCIEVSTRSIFDVSQSKSEYKVDFGCAFELVQHLIQFLVQEGVVE